MPLPLYLGLSRTEHSGASTSAVVPVRQTSGLSFESHERMITGSNRTSPEIFPRGPAAKAGLYLPGRPGQGGKL